MITHLISTTEFVKLICETSPYDLPDEVENNPLRCIHKYANFISQKPALWMFVACDKNGEVLEEPKGYKEYINKKSINWEEVPWNVDCHTFDSFKQAKERVLFKGFKCILKRDTFFALTNDAVVFNTAYHDNSCTIFTDEPYINFKGQGFEGSLENLMRCYKLELTGTALKQIGL